MERKTSGNMQRRQLVNGLVKHRPSSAEEHSALEDRASLLPTM